MKNLILLCMLTTMLSAHCGNYIKQGTVWNMINYEINQSGIHYSPWSLALDASAYGKDNLELIMRSPGSDDKNIGLVRCDGEKVYIKASDSDESSWNLIYDFGLKPGEGCLISSVSNAAFNNLFSSYVVCTGISKFTEFGDMDIISLDE